MNNDKNWKNKVTQIQRELSKALGFAIGKILKRLRTAGFIKIARKSVPLKSRDKERRTVLRVRNTDY